MRHLKKAWSDLSLPVDWAPVQYLALVPLLAADVIALLEALLVTTPDVATVLLPVGLTCGCTMVAIVLTLLRGHENSTRAFDTVVRGAAMIPVLGLALVRDLLALARAGWRTATGLSMRQRDEVRALVLEELEAIIMESFPAQHPRLGTTHDFSDDDTVEIPRGTRG